MKNRLTLFCVFLVAASHALAGDFELKDGVIRFFGNSPNDVRIVHEQVGTSKIWIDAVRQGGKTRKIRIYSENPDKKPVTVRFEYPFDEASATWSLPVRKEGSIVTVDIVSWGTLIGDRMDPAEGAEAALAARKSLGTADGNPQGLPTVYSSGDSISLGYWPYAEATLAGTADYYYQTELTNLHPEIKITNNGVADLAYGVLEAAYKQPDFKPRYVLMNFGLHMINRVGNKPDDYGRWMLKCHELARNHGSQLIWLTTTPYQKGRNDAGNKIVDIFNTLAIKIGREHNIPVIDLHAFLEREGTRRPPAEIYTPDGLHFIEPMKRAMGEFIGGEIKALVAEGKTTSH